jgi:hypothetical protein
MHLNRNLNWLYWAIRLGMAFIWIWTAVVSWFIYPEAESLNWLRRLGLTSSTQIWFTAACFLDFAIGIASALFASHRLWQAQLILVGFYSLAVSISLPEFLIHPFGPITKNIAVVGCLFYLTIYEGLRIQSVDQHNDRSTS